MKRASLLLGVFTIVTFWICQTGDVRGFSRVICESAHDEDWDEDSEDGGLACMDTLSGGDVSIVEEALTAIDEGGWCGSIRSGLENGPLREWTGWYETSYWWDGASRYDYSAIGVHHSFMGDSGLWAHEGAHYQGVWNEESAEYWREQCTFIIPPAPAPVGTSQLK